MNPVANLHFWWSGSSKRKQLIFDPKTLGYVYDIECKMGLSPVLKENSGNCLQLSGHLMFP